MLSVDELIQRARSRCLERGDYFDRSADFLVSIQNVPVGQLSHRQKQWLHGLKQDLRESWE